MNHLAQRTSQCSSHKLLPWLVVPMLLLAGCATTSQRGVNQSVEINSYPYEARVYIDGEPAGTTPLTAVLRSKTNYEVKFEKAGYKPYVEYIGPSMDLKHNPILKIGPLEDAGFYNRLGPNPLEVELEHVLVPDIAGTDILREMLVKTEQIDGLLRDGKIGVEEHRYVAQQIIDFYKDESARRGSPLASISPTPAPSHVDLPNAFTNPVSANPTAPMAIPGELDSLDNLDLNSLELPAPGTPMPGPAPASTGIPDLSGLDDFSLPDPTGGMNVPALEPTAPAPPPLAPPPVGIEATPLPTPAPATTPPAAPTTPAPTTPAPFDPLNFGT